MSYNPDIHHRRSIRLRGFDYAAAGAYFVTVCTQGRECLFGDVVGGAMTANDAGRMVEKWWLELPTKFPALKVDAFVVMPNHFHGVVFLVGAALRGRPPECDRSVSDVEGHPHRGAPTEPIGNPGPESPTLGDVINWFKTMTTNEYIRNIKHFGWAPFPGRLWQRNYFERVIRNDREMERVREYIVSNPLKWELDAENPANHPPALG